MSARILTATSTLVLTLAACGGDDGAAGVDAGVYPPMADLARDITHTALDIDLGARSGIATITLAPSSSTGASFEVGDLTIRAVEAAGAPLLYQVGSKQLDVGVPPSTEPLVVRVTYDFNLHEDSDGADSDGFTLTWPYHCGNLFPCKTRQDPADGTRFALELSGVEAAVAASPDDYDIAEADTIG